MNDFFEAAMMICLGVSWPVSVYKSWKSRTTKGKSLPFEVIILIGYIFGLIGKIINHNITVVFFIFIFNIINILIDLALYYRNSKLDKAAENTFR